MLIWRHAKNILGTTENAPFGASLKVGRQGADSRQHPHRWFLCPFPSLDSGVPPALERSHSTADYALAMGPEPDLNVVGGELLPCSLEPLTGFYRNGCCSTGPEDVGSHTVCVLLTEDFLAFSAQAGNDLSTPRPEWGFPGLVPGDRWCLCASRWLEAHRAGCAPEVVLGATHARALEVVPIELLAGHAAAG